MKSAPFLDLRGLVAGTAVVLVLGGGLFLGSRTLRHYDPALLIYTFGVLFSAFAVTYRYAVWLQRPPTRLYWQRGWQLCLAPPGEVLRRLHLLTRAFCGNFMAQRFIHRRSPGRWFAHFCLAWGTLLAAAVTFPLVFGWLHFESRPDDPQVYQVLLFGLRVGAFHTQSAVRYVLFNLLNLSAVLVILGVGLTLHRRLQDASAVASQQFGTDLVPLLMLLAISVTGLMLTFSMYALRGAGYVVISLIHAVTVITTLLYLPFGKLFHIFQRPLHLSVLAYRQANAAAPPAVCCLCGEGFAGARHVEDLKAVLTDVGLDGRLPAPVTHYLHVCPRCRRRQLGVSHAKTGVSTNG
jgi:hypothetical protein